MTIVRKSYNPILLLFLCYCFFLSATKRADAACGDADRIQCQTAFNNLSSVVRTDSGFVAVGQMRTGSSATLGYIRFSPSGQPMGNAVGIPFPLEIVSSGKTISGEGRKIIPLPDGGAALLGQITVNEDKQIPWAVRIAPDGRVLWSRAFPDETGAIAIFSSGYYESNGARLIIVGRRTSGADDGQRCMKWSQSMVTSLRISDGRQDLPPLFMGSQASTLTNRQAIWDIAAGDKPNTYVVVGFASSANKVKQGECQDDILIQTLTLSSPSNNTAGSWSPGQARKFGAQDAGEVAFVVKRSEDGAYLIAGYGKTSDGAPAAQVYRIRLGQTPPIENQVNTPFPDGADKIGADRFRAIVQLTDKSHFLLAGSGKRGRQDRNNLAFWQVFSAQLNDSGPIRQFSSQTGSDISDAALGDNGQIFAVGTWVDNDGQAYGFAGFITIEDQNEKIVIRRRLPDTQLPPVSDLAKVGNIYQIPPTKLFSVQGFFGREMPSDGITLGFSLTNSRTVKVSALSDGGNLDLVLLDANKRPIAFSNYSDPASQLLVATLPAGSYIVSVATSSPSHSYEIRLTPASEFSIDALTQLQKLPDARRQLLSSALRAAGYGSSPEPDICFGSETLRSLAAVQSGGPSSSPIISASFDPLVFQSLATKR